VASFFVAALILSHGASAGFFNGKVKFYTIKTPHFYIHFSEGLGPIAEEFRAVTENVYDRMTARMEWKPARRTHVVLTDKSDTSNGVASVLPDNTILLYTAMPTPDSTLDHYRDYYEYLVTHEFTHILHIDQHNRTASPPRVVMGKIVAPNGATPGWMREGMAVYEESLLDPNFGRNHSDYTEMFVRTAFYEEKFPRLDQIAGLTAHPPGGLGPYVYGGRFFDWLAKTYGEDRMYQYQKEYASGMWLYSLNNKARRVYGKSFYKLWQEFKADLGAKYAAEKDRLNGIGLTALSDVVRNKDAVSGYTPGPGGAYAYFQSGLDDAPHIVVRGAGGAEHPIKRRVFGQMAFSRDGKYLAFGSLSSVEKKTSLAETYYYDVAKRRLFRVYEPGFEKKSMHVMDPDFSPADGGNRWMVMVRDNKNTDQLYVYDTLERRGYVITDAAPKTRFSNPRYSPDGTMIAVSRKDPDSGHRDIIVYNHIGRELARVTNDSKIDMQPAFSGDGAKIYYSSSRTGVFNVFAYDLGTGAIDQVTNVLTGVFQPMPGVGTGEIYVQTFSTGNPFVQKFSASVIPAGLLHDKTAGLLTTNKSAVKGPRKARSVSKKSAMSVPAGAVSTGEVVVDVRAYPAESVNGNAVEEPDSKPVIPIQTDEDDNIPVDYKSRKTQPRNNGGTKTEQQEKVVKTYPSQYKDELGAVAKVVPIDVSNPPDAKKYSALPHILRPTYLVPNVQMYDNAVIASALIGRTDPLFRHSWSAYVNYRSDAKFTGGGGTYVYSRYDPTFYLGGLRYAVDWGTITTRAGSSQFFEERWQTFAGANYRWKLHGVNLAYFYEHRGALTPLAGVNLVNMKPYAGVKLQYQLANFKKFSDSISQEDGPYLKAGVDLTDQILGSNAVNEEFVTTADARYYLEMPWSDHHVLAFRAAGGWQWGDVQQFGTFRLGGPFGEGQGAAQYSNRVFPMRGLAGITYGGDRAVIFSVEYRWPLAENVNTGIGTWPIFLDKLYLAPFIDGGDIKYRAELQDLFTRMLVAGGAELKGDFVLGYGLPITARLGYGIIFTNRDRLGVLQDAITRASLKFGSAYFQVGTSF
jgi:hypothetical protein